MKDICGCGRLIEFLGRRWVHLEPAPGCPTPVPRRDLVDQQIEAMKNVRKDSCDAQ